MNFAHGEPVDIVRPVLVVDRYGNQAPDWTTPTTYRLARCAIAPGNQVEVTDGRESGVEVDHTVYVTPAAGTGIYGWTEFGEPVEAIRPTDRLRIRGEDHEVVGRIEVWQSPFSGWRPGCVVRTKRVEG